MLRNRWLIFAHDLLWVPVSIALTYLIVWDFAPLTEIARQGAITLTLLALPAHAFAFTVFGCYRGIWRFASVPDLMRLVGSVLLGAAIVIASVYAFADATPFKPSRLVIYPMLLLLGIGGMRVLYRYVVEHRLRAGRKDAQRALVVGAGRAGEMLVRDLGRTQAPFLAVGFVDDDPAKQGYELQGLRVFGKLADLPGIIDRYQIDVVLIAMPSAPRQVLDAVVETCAEKRVECRTLPSLVELADGRVEVSRLRPVTVEDLLGREAVRLDEQAITSFLRDKIVLVTGGGGSIGSELCRQVIAQKPALLVIVEHSEFNLYQIELELRASHPSQRVKAVLADVKNAGKVERIFQRFQPDVVFHAAAYKHVPMIEHNPLEGITNNVQGTKVVADLAAANNVETFVLISTDKTVNPTNVMGASKRVAELYCQAFNRRSKTRFVTTRFGNVLGSAGSVIPLFEQQIRSGGPVTVTHPEITRYFMTIPEAASLILQAGAMGQGGEIFVLDMGQPVKILDLAKRLIQLSGLQPGRDVQIEFTGLRPGEKMHEELFYEKEPLVGTDHPKLLQAGSAPVDWDWLQQELAQMLAAADAGEAPRAVDMLKSLIPEFRSAVEALEREEMMRSAPNLRVVK